MYKLRRGKWCVKQTVEITFLETFLTISITSGTRVEGKREGVWDIPENMSGEGSKSIITLGLDKDFGSKTY